MNNKKVDQQERKQQMSEKEELERMLQNSAETLEHLSDEAKKLSSKHKPLVFDYSGIMSTAQEEAQDIVSANAFFYLNENIIETTEYIQQKMRADIATMSDLLRQSKIAEFAIIRMLEQIEEGNMHPRQFEVLAGFQRSKLELTKSIANYVVVMENNYKAIKEDYRAKNDEEALDIESEEVTENSDGSTQRGTRSLIQTIRTELDRKEMEENRRKLEKAEQNKNKTGDIIEDIETYENN